MTVKDLKAFKIQEIQELMLIVNLMTNYPIQATHCTVMVLYTCIRYLYRSVTNAICILKYMLEWNKLNGGNEKKKEKSLIILTICQIINYSGLNWDNTHLLTTEYSAGDVHSTSGNRSPQTINHLKACW